MFATLAIKKYYDRKHTPKFFSVRDWVALRLYKGYTLADILNSKLRQQFAGPFKVLERVGKIAYRLELPPNIKIHSVILMVYLELMPGQDLY